MWSDDLHERTEAVSACCFSMRSEVFWKGRFIPCAVHSGHANKDSKAAKHVCDDEALDVEHAAPFRRVMKLIVALDVG